MAENIRIGTRGSKLALWQANKVQTLLKERHPFLTFEIKTFSTEGDLATDAPLYALESQGVFTKELDRALLENRIDMAVHSLKDVETSLPSKIVLACYLKRDSKEDALIVRSSLRATTKSLNQLESENGIIGTSSVRRKAFLARNFPFLKTVDIRGNIDTRIEKMETRDISALILSAAGLERMGWSHLIAEKLDVPHAVSQGAIAVACLESKTKIAGLLETVDDEETRLSCIAERALLSGLKGGCKVPVGVTTSFSRAGMQFNLKLRAAVCSLDGKEFCEESEQIKFENNGEKEVEAAKLGIRVAESLDKKGAQRILRGCRDLVAASCK